MVPANLRYAESHEWARLEGDIVTVGITQYAVEQLTDVTYLKLPAPGLAVAAGQSFGEIESVKTVSDLYAPVAGTVTEVNTQLKPDDPALVTQDPYGKGWMIKIRVPAGTTLDKLKTPEQYQEQIAGEA
jgi:glycine cleavage system H protein